MIYRFGPFELDLDRVELRAQGKPRHLERQVFTLLALLVENHARLVSKDEIVERVWDGRIVSDAAVASRVKSARQALGDDGRAQRFIKTVHRQGFRFLADVRAVRTELAPAAPEPRIERIQPSLAVLPFRTIGGHARYQALAGAFADELITELSRLRWLLVTARGSAFRVRTDDTAFGDIGRLLGVRYCLSGTLEISGARLIVSVELVDTQDEAVVWADRFSGRIDDVHAMREEVRARVLVALDLRIPMHEAARARHAVPEDLDAWSVYHLGLQHVYRFNRADNAVAAQWFERAVTLDPCFARAHAGLSFVHFQTAFMGYQADVAAAVRAARRCAKRGLELDALDPFVNFTMGRSYWLEGDLQSSLSWLERCTAVSPNYAQGIYARAWTEVLAGAPAASRAHVDLAMRLSPIDPLYYAMLATRALTHLRSGEHADAAAWAERAARSPGAHVLIAMIAAALHALNGDAVRAAAWAANVRERSPTLRWEQFIRAFPMPHDALRPRVMQALKQLGF